MKVSMDFCWVSLSFFSLRKRLQLIRLLNLRKPPKTEKTARFTRPLSEFIKAAHKCWVGVCTLSLMGNNCSLSGSSGDATVSHHAEVLPWSHPCFLIIPNEVIFPPNQTRIQLFLQSSSCCLLRINKHLPSPQDRIKRNTLPTLYGRLLFSIKFWQVMVVCLISSMSYPWVNCPFIFKRSPNQTHEAILIKLTGQKNIKLRELVGTNEGSKEK